MFADFADIPTFATFFIRNILALDMYIHGYVRTLGSGSTYTLGLGTIVLLCEQKFLKKLVVLYVTFMKRSGGACTPESFTAP